MVDLILSDESYGNAKMDSISLESPVRDAAALFPIDHKNALRQHFATPPLGPRHDRPALMGKYFVVIDLGHCWTEVSLQIKGFIE